MPETVKTPGEIASTGGFLEPEKIVASLDLEKGDHVADFGAGHGYFTIPIAKIVGGDGKVYAFDIQKSVLEIIRARAKLEHLLNIELVWADLDQPGGSKLKDNFCEFVIMANILFQAENKQGLFQEASRVLQSKGRLAVIEWDETPAPLGPPLHMRIKKEAVKQWASQTGLAFDREFATGSHHYGLLFRKP